MSRVRKSKNYKSNSKSPILMPFFHEEGMYLDRGEYVCRNEELFIDILSFEFCIAGGFNIRDFKNSTRLIIS